MKSQRHGVKRYRYEQSENNHQRHEYRRVHNVFCAVFAFHGAIIAQKPSIVNERGALFVLWAAFCAGIGKLFGKRGVFYEMVGQEVSGLDGFYDHEFQEYGEFGIRIPENPGKVCDEIEAATGVQAMIVDANDLNVEILGKAASITLDDETLKGLIRDNPAGQSRELTPFILIREVK